MNIIAFFFKVIATEFYKAVTLGKIFALKDIYDLRQIIN